MGIWSKPYALVFIQVIIENYFPSLAGLHKYKFQAHVQSTKVLVHRDEVLLLAQNYVYINYFLKLFVTLYAFYSLYYLACFVNND